MKKRLYDFSVGYLVLFLITYGLLFAATLYNLIATSRKITSAILFGLVLASFIVIIVRFGFLTAYVTEEKIADRKRSFSKSDAVFLAKYDLRFRESVIIVRDKNTNYLVLGDKEARRRSIIVQATDRNRKLLGNFFGTEIEAAKKPKRKAGRK